MRSLLLALLALAAAAPAAAQDDEALNPIIRSTYAAPPRALYLAAMDAMEARGIGIRARMLDQALLTMPEFGGKEGSRDTASVLVVEFAPSGDSTEMVVQARLVTRDGQLVSNEKDLSMAHVLTAEMMIVAAIDSAMDKLAPGAGKPDPREETDTYAYGNRNPVATGGGQQNGAANQRRWLDGLRGPAGEPVRYRRLGSCCEYNRGGARGVLDAYEVTYDGLARPVVLFLDLYAEPRGVQPPPEGFTAASPSTPATR
jgi:hypothetical protein